MSGSRDESEILIDTKGKIKRTFECEMSGEDHRNHGPDLQKILNY